MFIWDSEGFRNIFFFELITLAFVVIGVLTFIKYKGNQQKKKRVVGTLIGALMVIIGAIAAVVLILNRIFLWF